MAGAGKGQAGNKKAAPSQAADKKPADSFPGLKAPGKADAKAFCEEAQKDEILALQAIYDQDFIEHEPAHNAWKKTEPTFDIRVKASNDDFALTLGVVLVATYPKSPPLLTIKEDDGLRESIRFKIQKYVETRPKVLASNEEAMITTIVEDIREILEDAAQKKAQGVSVPSLEEERAAHEAQLARLAQDEKEQQERQRLEESKEEAKALDDMVQEELKRRKAKAIESRKKNRSQRMIFDLPAEDEIEDEEPLVLDQPCKLLDSSGNAIFFKTVIGKTPFREGPVTAVYKVKPVLSASQIRPSLILKQAVVKSHGKDTFQLMAQLRSLESQLESVKKTEHQRLLRFLDFRIDRGIRETDTSSSTIWTVSILTLLADKGPLDELLELAGNLDVGKVRIWTTDLLEALAYLHSNGIIHRDIHPGNILLCREPTGDTVPKIADASYQRELHNLCSNVSSVPSTRAAKSAYWFPPEIAGASKPQYTQKTDVWDFGIVFLQMLFGLNVLQKYQSPTALVESLALSRSLKELVENFFKPDSKKRPRAFELISSEFLATDALVLVDDGSAIADSLISLPHSLPRRQRYDSMSGVMAKQTSRYLTDFEDEILLGRGGFGEVVRSRSRFDGRFYAVKKITQRSSETLTEILKEVRLLSQMNHPSVVRYYNSWMEEVPGSFEDEEDTVTEGGTADGSQDTVSRGDVDIVFGLDSKSVSRGFDYMSSNHGPLFESDEEEDGAGGGEGDGADESGSESSGDDDAASDSDSEVGEESSRVGPRRALQRARSRRPLSTVFISMEYCEKRSLRDLISRNLSKETQEVWRLFRQILEGLVHIHGLNIVHRDLKPENIFIKAEAEGVDNVKIGDFGLATSGQLAADKGAAAVDSGDLTRSIGTAAYLAPEVRTGGSGSYTAKVDMYSLGVIFFEMSYPPISGMERAIVIEKIRRSPPSFPADFKPSDKNQMEVITSLLTHSPKERPSSSELMKSGKLPLPLESETIRRAIASIADPNSPYLEKVLSAIFERQIEQAKDYAWDMAPSNAPVLPDSTDADLMRQYLVKDTLISIFRRHGAVEVPTSHLYPRSPHYGPEVFQVLDRDGTVLQLPYDLVMGHARSLARSKNSPVVQRSFSFGSIFRNRSGGGKPNVIGEVDFDIVSTDVLDLALKEAEVIKVLDEITVAFPTTISTAMCFHLGHSDLLNVVFDFCGIPSGARRAVAEIFSHLNTQHTWQKVRSELRAPEVGISATAVDELQRFDFRDTPSKAISKIKGLLEGTEHWGKASPTLAHIREVYEYTKKFGVTRKIYICPLNCPNERLYHGGFSFACLYDKKKKDIFAAGGRFDGLIREHRPRIGNRFEERHAVGFHLNWVKLVKEMPKSTGKAFLKKPAEEEAHGIFSAKRCDVVVASLDPSILRSDGIELLQALWAHGISAELARDARSPEDLLNKYREDSYSWIVIIKPDNILKIKTVSRRDAQDVDISGKELLSWLKSEIRDRDSRSIMKYRAPGSTISHSESTTAAGSSQKREVKLLISQTKTKKGNRSDVVGDAKSSAAKLVQGFLEGPIAVVETSDDVLDMVRSTSLSDAESWRKVEQRVGPGERNYVRQLHEMLKEWRSELDSKNSSSSAFIYNHKTSKCIYYDLGA